jgi:colanic acid biosynthesis glycosyl transferase WcaI
MGKPQHLDVLLQAAARLKQNTHIQFLFIGDGAERVALLELAKSRKLSNVRFLPYQSYSLMNEIYAASDVSYVPQAAGTSSDGVPSKVYRIMACGRPVLAATDSGSDLAGMVVDSLGGTVVSATSDEEVAETIYSAFQNRSDWSSKGERARHYIARNYSRSQITLKYHNLLNHVADEKRREIVRQT